MANFFIPNIWRFNIVLVSYIFAPYKWWNAMLSISVEDLNTYHDYCVGITKIQLIAKTWDPKIGPTITRGEVHEAQWITRNFINFLLLSLKELG
jgi:hypothetical protein